MFTLWQSMNKAWDLRHERYCLDLEAGKWLSVYSCMMLMHLWLMGGCLLFSTATPLLPKAMTSPRHLLMTSPRHLLNKFFLSGVANMLIEVIIATKRAQWIVIYLKCRRKTCGDLPLGVFPLTGYVYHKSVYLGLFKWNWRYLAYLPSELTSVLQAVSLEHRRLTTWGLFPWNISCCRQKSPPRTAFNQRLPEVGE